MMLKVLLISLYTAHTLPSGNLVYLSIQTIFTGGWLHTKHTLWFIQGCCTGCCTSSYHLGEGFPFTQRGRPLPPYGPAVETCHTASCGQSISAQW